MSADTAYICEGAVYVVGWMLDYGEVSHIRLTVLGQDLSFMSSMVCRYDRPDVKEVFGASAIGFQAGFVCIFEIENFSLAQLDSLGLSISVVYENKPYASKMDRLLGLDEAKQEALQAITHAWDPELAAHRAKAKVFLRPLLQALYPSNRTANSTRIDYGHVPSFPQASIIIPLYRRYDFMRYQLSNFSRHKSVKDFEVIYVVDDPAIDANVRHFANVLFKTFKQPFSVVSLSENMGFAKANNIGVSHANSDNLILMNSDVLPCNVNWATKLINALESDPKNGIVGVRLLYEDGSIQHDGMCPMTIPEYGPLLFNDHPGKAEFRQDVAENKQLETCELSTAACIAIAKNFFDSLGGFDPEYILGDFEDSDLCLKSIAAGRVNKILRLPNIYHLERQSQNLVGDLSWKHKITIYNAITYNERWAQKLQSISFDI